MIVSGAEPLRVHAGVPGQVLERQHDQPVAGQQRQLLTEGTVHGGLATAGIGIVEAGHDRHAPETRNAAAPATRPPRRRPRAHRRRSAGHRQHQAGASTGAW
jgi:hypothetical protein